MKKFFLVILTLFCCLQIQADCTEVRGNSVTMNHVRVGSSTSGSIKKPEAPIYLWQEDHTFTLPVFDDMIVLLLIDNNDVEVYWAMIPVGTTIVNLPSSYTGNYELRLVLTDNSYYVGDITL